MSETLVVGVIGGSGLYEMDGLEGLEELRLSTPFGAPSDAYLKGRLGGVTVVFLPRHGAGIASRRPRSTRARTCGA
jgi:5'-methylthioadenosine phosphorylase